MKIFKRRTTCLGLALCGLLLACDRQEANAAAGEQYEITTQTRPESMAKYREFVGAGHRVCAVTRDLMKLPPPPPMVQLPDDFVTERTTYISNGKAYLQRTEAFHIDMSKLTAELGCKSRLVSTVTETLVQDGNIQSAVRSADGTVEIDEPEPLPPPMPGAANGYTERKTLKGFALQCLPPADVTAPGVLQDLCVPGTGLRIPLDGLGKVVVVHARMTLIENGNHVLLTEPVSIQIGKPVSPARLAFSVGY